MKFAFIFMHVSGVSFENMRNQLTSLAALHKTQFLNWCHGQVVRQRSATPLSPVQIRVAPPKTKSRCSNEQRLFSFQLRGLNYPLLGRPLTDPITALM